MFEVTVSYECEFQQVCYGVRCGFDAWSFTFGLLLICIVFDLYFRPTCTHSAACYVSLNIERKL